MNIMYIIYQEKHFDSIDIHLCHELQIFILVMHCKDINENVMFPKHNGKNKWQSMSEIMLAGCVVIQSQIRGCPLFLKLFF